MKQKGFVPILILVGVLILAAAGGAYYLGTKKASVSQIQVIPSQTPQAISSPSSTPDETANWKTYNQDKYQIKFPEGFVLNSKVYDGIGGQVQQDEWSNNKTTIRIFAYREGIDPIVSILTDKNPEEKITVANQSVPKVMAKYQPLIHIGPIKNAGINYKIVYTFPSTLREQADYNQFDQILSTFRFEP